MRRIGAFVISLFCVFSMGLTAFASSDWNVINNNISISNGTTGVQPNVGSSQSIITQSGGNWSQQFQTSDINQKVVIQNQITVYPVYQFYNAVFKDHFWTISSSEKASLDTEYETGKGFYQYKGIAGYASDVKLDGFTPVYRFWNKKTLDHFYTTSKTEKKSIEKDLKSGKDNYEYEGVAFYVPKEKTSNSKAVYRFFDTAAFNHYYTTDVTIANQLLDMWNKKTGTYRYEGIDWYWY